VIWGTLLLLNSRSTMGSSMAKSHIAAGAAGVAISAGAFTVGSLTLFNSLPSRNSASSQPLHPSCLPEANGQVKNSVERASDRALVFSDTPLKAPPIPLYSDRAQPAFTPFLLERVKEGSVTVDEGLEDSASSGSGFWIKIKDELYVVTNAHVVEDAVDDGNSLVSITTPGGESLPVRIVGVDTHTDIALLRPIQTPVGSVAPLPLGDSNELLQGTLVATVGAALGLPFSSSEGKISGPLRALDTAYPWPVLQVSAEVNPGNSGGPLVYVSDGTVKVGGSVFARRAPSDNIGFVIPINEVKGLFEQLAQKGAVSHSFIGACVVDLSPTLFNELRVGGLVDSLQLKGRQHTRGVLVTKVREDSAAEEAGLRAGDLIKGVNGEEIPTIAGAAYLREFIAGLPSHGTALLTIVRKVAGEDRTLHMSVKVQPRPAELKIKGLRVPPLAVLPIFNP
jgi:S1-C subfamily serine protease